MAESQETSSSKERLNQSATGDNTSNNELTDQIEGYRLPTTFCDDYVEHRIVYSDRNKGIRKGYKRQRWTTLPGFLGRGGFGVVRLQKEKKTSQLRAVKEVPHDSDTAAVIDPVRELIAMAALSKDISNFVQLHGWYRDEQNLFIAMEYFELGDLGKCVVAPLPELECQAIIAQITEALDFMHKRNIAHRDLKPSNIFVAQRTPQWWVKVADFGISKRYSETTTLFTMLNGDSRFAAPEMMQFTDDTTGTVTASVDIWSLGCLAAWLLIYDVLVPTAKMFAFALGNYAVPLHLLGAQGASDQAIDFVKRCVCYLPTERLTAETALDHPWLQQALIAHGSDTSSIISVVSAEHTALRDTPAPVLASRGSMIIPENPEPLHRDLSPGLSNPPELELKPDKAEARLSVPPDEDPFREAFAAIATFDTNSAQPLPLRAAALETRENSYGEQQLVTEDSLRAGNVHKERLNTEQPPPRLANQNTVQYTNTTTSNDNNMVFENQKSPLELGDDPLHDFPPRPKDARTKSLGHARRESIQARRQRRKDAQGYYKQGNIPEVTNAEVPEQVGNDRPKTTSRGYDETSRPSSLLSDTGRDSRTNEIRPKEHFSLAPYRRDDYGEYIIPLDPFVPYRKPPPPPTISDLESQSTSSLNTSPPRKSAENSASHKNTPYWYDTYISNKSNAEKPGNPPGIYFDDQDPLTLDETAKLAGEAESARKRLQSAEQPRAIYIKEWDADDTLEASKKQQSIARGLTGAIGRGGKATTATASVGYDKKSEDTSKPYDTSSITTRPRQISKNAGPGKHYLGKLGPSQHYSRESIPTTAYPAGQQSSRAVAPPLGGTQPQITNTTANRPNKSSRLVSDVTHQPNAANQTKGPARVDLIHSSIHTPQSTSVSIWREAKDATDYQLYKILRKLKHPLARPKVPDAAEFQRDLDMVRSIAEGPEPGEEPEEKSKAAAIRGASSATRQLSTSRKGSAKSHARADNDKLGVPEDQVVEWDGLRRRKSLEYKGSETSQERQNRDIHPPLGMSHFPENDSRRSFSFANMGEQRPTEAVKLSPSEPSMLSNSGKSIGARSTPSERSVDSTHSIDNPGLLATVEDAIRRLILPELKELDDARGSNITAKESKSIDKIGANLG